jgi:PIN domain nuclease of toxin-antitoxin system
VWGQDRTNRRFSHSTLPTHHRDPFDRRLVAQWQLEDLPILTTDPLFEQYDVEMISG